MTKAKRGHSAKCSEKIAFRGKCHTPWRKASLQSSQWQNTLKVQVLSQIETKIFLNCSTPPKSLLSIRWDCMDTNLQGSCLLGVERCCVCSMKIWGFWATVLVSKIRELFHSLLTQWRLTCWSSKSHILHSHVLP